MAISDERIDDFIAHWQEAFGKSITRDEAGLVATKLVTFYRLITQPLPQSATNEDIGEVRDVDATMPLPDRPHEQTNAPAP